VGLHNRKSLEPWIKDEVDYFPHQTDAIRTMAGMRNILLADDMGLGKTLQALTVFAIDVYRGWGEKLLIVAPVSLKENWHDEIVKFTGFRSLMLGLERNATDDGWKKLSPVKRDEQLMDWMDWESPKILIVNYEQVPGYLGVLNKVGFDMVFFDEAHYLQNPKAQRTRACLNLVTNRVIELTGSPLLNHVNGLWALLNRLDPQQFPSFWSFAQRYCVFGGYKDKQIVGVKNEKELREKLHPLMIRRLKKDVFQAELRPDPDTGELVPLYEPKVIQKVIELAPEQRKLYDQVDKELILPGPDGDPQAIENALTKFLRLKQICGTTATVADTDISSKLDAIVEDTLSLLEAGQPVVFFTQFRGVLECYAQRIADARKGKDAIRVWQLHGDVKTQDRQKIVNQWSKNKDPGVLACMLQVAGVGLNMTAANYCLFADKLFAPMMNKQAVDRLNRIGQTTPVTVFEYLAAHTKEQRVEAILRAKNMVNDNIVEDTSWNTAVMAALREAENSARV
jgi:SNF2 family DNA or RNA helicase